MKGIVYVLRARERWDMIYIGSTFQTLEERYRNHINNFKRDETNNSKFVFRQFGIQNVIIEKIREYDVCDREHLEVYETLWIENFKDVVVNRNRPFCINKLYIKEYHKKNKDEIRKKLKQYREKNKDEIREKKKQYREKHKEEIREKRKQHWEEHKDERREYNKQYYEKNRDELNKKKRQKLSCDICRKLISKNYISYHKKRKH